MALARTYQRYVAESITYYFKGLVQALDQKEIFLWAQAIAFKVLITIVPILILVTGLVGILLQRSEPFEQVAQIIREFFPPGNAEQLVSFLDQLQEAANLFTLLGAAALLFAAVTVFSTLRVVVASIFQEEWHDRRSIVGGYLFDIRMAVQVGILFILTIGLSVALQGVDRGLFDGTLFDWQWLAVGWRRVITGLGLLIPYLLTTAMFFQLFYFIPLPHPPKRSALLGAFVTALLWEAAKFSFAAYAASFGQPERFGGGAEGFPLGNTFALVILFVFWIYFSGVVLIIGGIIAALHEKRHRLKGRTGPVVDEEEDLGDVEEGLPPDAPLHEIDELSESAQPDADVR
jgi:membrane protein